MIDPDADLIAGCKRGDPAAQRALYQKHKRRIHSAACQIVDRAEAEEVLQDVFIKVFKELLTFRGDSLLTTWMHRITTTTALNHLRNKKRIKRTLPKATSTEAMTGDIEGDMLEVAAVPEVKRDQMLAAQLSKAMAKLPPRYQTILKLHDIDELSHPECAEIMKCSEGNCKSQLHHARARMRELLTLENI